ncbi:MAG: [LysW]-aminoadipate kinase [Anaerolineaceae bacterium]|nr:MAG: [LysW]-aminoadipate kinase [Anaerolineaceae bacterium]
MSQDILVVKIGGGAGLDLAQTCADLAEVARQRPVVIVHGVSAMMADLAAERGLTERMLTSPSGHRSRYTDAPTRDLFVQASGRVAEQIGGYMGAGGVQIAHLADCITGTRKRAIRAVVDGRVRVIRDDYSGSIQSVNTAPILGALAAGQVPVISPMALDMADGLLNIDGDRAAAAVASALGASMLVILSNVRGLYRQFPDESSFVSRIAPEQIERAMDWAQGRMKRKVLGAQEALAGGVRQVVVSDGRIHHPVTAALSGAGTVFAP